MFGDIGWPLNASRGLSAIAEFLVLVSLHLQNVVKILLSEIIDRLREKNEYVPQLRNWENHS